MQRTKRKPPYAAGWCPTFGAPMAGASGACRGYALARVGTSSLQSPLLGSVAAWQLWEVEVLVAGARWEPAAGMHSRCACNPPMQPDTASPGDMLNHRPPSRWRLSPLGAHAPHSAPRGAAGECPCPCPSLCRSRVSPPVVLVLSPLLLFVL